MPATRDANAITERSLNAGASTTRICAISSEISIAAQIKTSVSGLSATTERMPKDVRINVPTQLMGLGKLLRTTAVRMMARHSVARLNVNVHAIPSPTNVGDWENNNSGSQAGNWTDRGICACHTNTLIHPSSAPPVAINQL